MDKFPASHYLMLNGSPLERGRIHGETLRGQIRALIGAWKERLASTMRIDPGQYLQELVSETDFIPAIERYTPGLLEEVKGIAEGAGMGFNEIFAFQLQDEEWWFG